MVLHTQRTCTDANLWLGAALKTADNGGTCRRLLSKAEDALGDGGLLEKQVDDGRLVPRRLHRRVVVPGARKWYRLHYAVQFFAKF